MSGRRPTRNELDETIISMGDVIDSLKSNQNILLDTISSLKANQDALQKENKLLSGRLAQYENANTPSSAESPEMKYYKKKKKNENKDNKSGKKSGGQNGHTGVSRNHNPENTIHHNLPKIPRCKCGCYMEIISAIIRDILDIEITTSETRHIIQRAMCKKCNKIVNAPNDLPMSGSYGKNFVGFVAQLRAARVPLEGIRQIIESTTDMHIAKSTITNTMARVGDALQKERNTITNRVTSSDHVGIDETGMPLGDKKGWVWVIQSGKNIMIVYHKSRGGMILDRYMDKYIGIVTTDGYRVYLRFDSWLHQLCWAHVLRNAEHLAQKRNAHPDTGLLHADLQRIYQETIYLLECLGPSVRLRQQMEQTLNDVLDKYRDSGDEDLDKLIASLDRCTPSLFTFAEHRCAEPTNNSSERALRYVVVFRKISGQIKGGEESMRRMSNFVTCVLTWKAHGMSIAHEVARRV